MKFKTVLIVVILFCNCVFSQNKGIIEGKVIDIQTREPISLINVLITGTSIGGTTNDNGEFEISDVPLGYFKAQFSGIGYKTVISEDYLVTLDKSPFLLIELTPVNEQLDEVLVESSQFKKTIENPLSFQSLGVSEIEKNPGGERDVLKVLQSLPGVAFNPGFRNDIIIRGGAPSESKFYIDGIEVPVINHFQTQGSSGGPVGIINADLIRNVDFFTSSFSANRGDALSAVVEFTQKEGNPNKLNSRVTLGTSDAGVTIDGPLSDKTSFIASVRQSYLQFLFKLIKLPFLPTYNDFQFNIKHKASNKNEIAIIGLGAIDKFRLNEGVNIGIVDEDKIKRNTYILNNIPIQEQWNYTVGATYKHFGERSFQQFVVSRSVWNNNATKYFDNSNLADDLLLNYASKEIENKLRIENTSTLTNNVKFNIGIGLENANYSNETYQKIANSGGVTEVEYNSKLMLVKYNVFSQISKKFFENSLGFSFGIRFDGVNYNNSMSNLFNQFSPRISLSYNFNNELSFNASSGIYYQLPSYTILGYRDFYGELINKKNNIKYIKSTHYVSGLGLTPNKTSKFTLEGFYKKYSNYPFSVRDEISLANLGSDFGVIGNEEVVSKSAGRAFGLELFAQKKSYNGLYGIFSYTFVRSEFENNNKEYTASSWDNRHILTITSGKKFNKNWEIGGKFKFIGGQPYTPYNLESSSIKVNYDVANSGILDFSKLNSQRFNSYHQLDVRIDKTWFWDKYSINFYFDIQNLYGNTADSQSFLIPLIDENGNKVSSPTDNSKYVLEDVSNSSGTILPRFGVIVDF